MVVVVVVVVGAVVGGLVRRVVASVGIVGGRSATVVG